MEIKNKILSNTVYVNDDSSEVSVRFWPTDVRGVETALLHFKVKNESGGTCDPEPFKITYECTLFNVGKKINIEIAQNGFIVKVGSDVHVVSSPYDLKNMIDEIITITDKHEFEYDANEHTFENLDVSMIKIDEELGR